MKINYVMRLQGPRVCEKEERMLLQPSVQLSQLKGKTTSEKLWVAGGEEGPENFLYVQVAMVRDWQGGAVPSGQQHFKPPFDTAFPKDSSRLPCPWSWCCHSWRGGWATFCEGEGGWSYNQLKFFQIVQRWNVWRTSDTCLRAMYCCVVTWA